MTSSFAANPQTIKSAGANFAQAADQARVIDQNLQDHISGKAMSRGRPSAKAPWISSRAWAMF